MQNRHRIPTIFNLSMVDVLCCALGCVILLWLVYFKEARERAVAAGTSGKELLAVKMHLQTVSGDMAAARQALAASQHKLEYSQGQYLEATGQRDQLLAKWEQADKSYNKALKSLDEAQARVSELEGELRNAEALQLAASANLAQKMRENNRLINQVLGAGQTIRDLEQVVGVQKNQLALATSHAADLKSQIKQIQAQTAKFEQSLAGVQAVSKEYASASSAAEARAMLLQLDLDKRKKEYSSQLSAAEAKAMLLQLELDKRKKDVADGNHRLDDLLALKQLLEQSLAATRNDLAKAQKDLAETKLANHGLAGESKVLSKKLDDLRLAADNRFAGIELTGRRAIFVIDMSGSMKMKDYYKEDPDKWPLLCEILGKIMQSLPDLTHFQVILFSDSYRYPLGNNSRWLEFKGLESVQRTIKNVLAVTPEGGTNMSSVFDEVFRFRDQGLDTVYFLSDGLPNLGEGLPANSAKMTEAEKGVHLGKWIRDRLKTTWNAPRGRWVRQRVHINAVGFYFDTPDVGAFLWALARDNEGGFVGLSKP